MAHRLIDEASIEISAGTGGTGCVSFRRERFVPRGGPDGGDGGKGGDVYLEASTALTSLEDCVRVRHYKAPHGENGGSANKTGANADDLVILVPIGTQVSGNGMRRDLIHPGEKLLVARGGIGGFGNRHFRSSTNRTPRESSPPTKGEQCTLTLSLKLLADVGLVGLPNAGKSSLITALTNAHPQVGAYPFTTTRPVLGVMEGRPRVVIADIPGLISGASTGKGLGIRFLKHIERTRVLIYVLDATEKDIPKQLEVLRQELASFSPQLLSRAYLVVLTKSDLIRTPPSVAHDFVVSSKTAEGIPQLKEGIRKLYAHAQPTL